MTKANITQYDSTPSNNADINDINIAENCPASNINNAIRELMAHLKNVDTGSQALTSPSFTAMSTDTISEKTSANGVAIDSVTLKDGELGTTASPVPINSSSLNGGQFGGSRNVIVNGAMQINQRSSSETGLGGSSKYSSLDRFKCTLSSTAGRFTMSKDTDTPNGFGSCMKLDCTTADTSIASAEVFLIQQPIEGQNVQQFKKGTSDAEKITVSFYMKTSKSFTFLCELDDTDNNRFNSQQFTTSTSWTRHVLTFVGDTTGELDNDNARSFQFGLFLHAGSNFTGGTYSANTWQSRQTTNVNRAVGCDSFFDSTSNIVRITGVQMEIGSVATPFEHRSFGEELLLCQRYYHRHESDGSSQNMFGVGFCDGTNNATVQIHFPTTMRTQPSALETTGTAGDYAIREGGGDVLTCNAVPSMSGDSTANVAVLGFTTSSSLTQHSGCMGRAVNSGVHLSFTSEL